MRAGRAAARSADVAAMIDADLAFHQAVYAASGNPLIERSAAPHWCQIRRAMGAVLQSAPARAAIWDEHAAIATAIAAGDVDTAERLAREHAERAGHHLGAALAAPAMPITRGDTA
jgi:DNA-binding GntR family transcriptional regulator